MATLLSVLKSCKVDGEKVVHLQQEDVDLVQQRLLLVLDDIIEICDEYDIPYQMGGGSCLGAVRHQGYIPWDDDIDINLRRRYIPLFLEKFRERFGDKYWIHVPGQTKGYDYMMIRIMTKDVRARALMESEKDECGLCIDMFPLENTFDNPVLRRIHGLGVMAYRYALSCIRFRRNRDEMISLVENSDAFKKYARKRVFLGRIFGLIPVDVWARGAERWVSMCHNEDSKYVAFAAGQKQFFTEMYLRKDYTPCVTVPFAGRNVRITADYDAYLTKLYGDYMTIPPVEKREMHPMLELDREALRRSLGLE